MAYHFLRMYQLARGFQLAAERCLETHEHPEQKTLPIQAIVNCAFACELYLKAIQVFENPNIDKLWGHHLDELYHRLPNQYKEKIESRLAVMYSKADIERYLSEFKKIFEEYRYIYEMESDDRIHFGFLHFFAHALQEVVGDLTHRYVYRLAGLEETI